MFFYLPVMSYIYIFLLDPIPKINLDFNFAQGGIEKFSLEGHYTCN